MKLAPLAFSLYVTPLRAGLLQLMSPVLFPALIIHQITASTAFVPKYKFSKMWKVITFVYV